MPHGEREPEDCTGKSGAPDDRASFRNGARSGRFADAALKQCVNICHQSAPGRRAP
jgi:hypothetical protein